MKKLIIFAVIAVVLQWWFTDPSITVPANLPSNEDVEISYVVKYSGYASRGDTLPMVVALHGNGSNPGVFYKETLTGLKESARVVLLRGIGPNRSGYGWPTYAPWLSLYGQPINDVIELLTQKFPTKGKPILMGFSGGAFVAFYLALKHGDNYSHIIPVSGNISKNLLGDGDIITGAKVTVFHGKSDNVTSFSGGKNGVELLEDNDVDVEFVAFNGGHHEIYYDTINSKIIKEIDNTIISLE